LLFGQVVIANGDLWVVAARVPDQAGVYAAVALIGRLVFVAAWSVITVIFPSLVSGGHQGPPLALIGRAVAVTIGLGALLTGATAAFSSELMAGMVGEGFQDGAGLLWPYALATTLFAVVNVVAVVDLAAERSVVPATVAMGGVVQTLVLFVGASIGVEWVVWAQVVLMSLLLAVACTFSTVGASMLRRLREDTAPGVSDRVLDPA
jgi:O-antigen/teichoic acid export membrane protein